MREIKDISIHCTDTPQGRNIDISDVRRWHVEERGWTDVGYHYLIKLDGTIQLGRNIDVIPAAVGGHNSKMIAIAYVGGSDNIDTRTNEQKASLVFLLNTLKRIFRDAQIRGHRDYPDVNKYCPSFDAVTEYGGIK